MTASPLLAPPLFDPASAAPLTRAARGCGATVRTAGDGLERRAGRLAAAFAMRFGAEPAVVTAAPASARLLGGDLGPTLRIAVDRYALAAVRIVGDGQVDLLTDRDFAAGAGLGSRAAERYAVRRALSELGRPDRLPWTAGELTARLGLPGTALVVGSASREVGHVALDLAAWDLSLLLLDTGARHLGADGALGGRRRVLDRAAATLGTTLRTATPEQLTALTGAADPVVGRYARHVVTERARVDAAMRQLGSGDVAALGELMTASHDSLSRDLRTTTRQLDRTVEAACAAGAVGARMAGAGLGGAVLALVPTAQVADVIAAVGEAAAEAGFPTPRSTPLAVAGRGRVVTPRAGGLSA
jgi:galactokinase